MEQNYHFIIWIFFYGRKEKKKKKRRLIPQFNLKGRNGGVWYGMHSIIFHNIRNHPNKGTEFQSFL